MPRPNPASPAVIVLAAGKGTRMKSALPKVLHPLAGFPMLWHVLTAAQTLKPARTVVITGYGAEQVEAYATQHFPGTLFARQKEQKGTGHAVMQAEKALKGHTGPVVIVYADIMLSTRPDVLPTLMAQHAKNASGLTLLTAEVTNPSGFGRIFIHEGRLINVEEKDCTPEQRAITTVNPCIYAVSGPLLWKLLGQVTNHNAQKEYYLTDILQLAAENGATVSACNVPAERPEIGMNSRAEIAVMELLWQTRRRQEMMNAGVTLADPATVYFSADTHIGADTTIGQHVVFAPGVTVADNVTILPFCHFEGCTVAPGARIGPFARIRPASAIGPDAHIGNFVEIKNSTIGKGTKAGHLTYVGDADVGANVNFGAGTITANFNSKTGKKSRTAIGDESSLGSNTVLVAPVKLGKGSYTGANTTVRADTKPHSLTVTKAETISKPGYSKK